MGFEFGDAFDFNEAAEVKRSSRNDNLSSEAAPTAEFLISAPQPPSSKAGKSTRRFVHR